jgi:hypothetical protein
MNIVVGLAGMYLILIIIGTFVLLSDLSTPSPKLPGWSWIMVFAAVVSVAVLVVSLRIAWLVRHHRPVPEVPESARDVE